MSVEITLRVMNDGDIPAGLRLREAAGWNQTEADWRRLLEIEPMGCFVACDGERVFGTVTAVTYEGGFGWIGMLLTDPRSRRQGIGTRLLHHAIAYLKDRGVECVRLDGTPMGHGLYLRHGFVDEYEIQRWQGRPAIGSGAGLPPVRESDLEEICRWDRRIFGADRSRLIASLWAGNPSCSALARIEGETAGYVLWRPGARAWYLGPCLADSAGQAELLIREMSSRVPGETVYVDICMENPWARQLFDGLGFQFQRPLARMRLGVLPCPGEPRLVCAIAGPEVG